MRISRPRRLAWIAAAAMATALIVAACGGSDPTPTPDAASGPPPRGDIRVPQGFQVVRYAGGFDHPTSMVVGPSGKLFVALQSGEILTIADENNDGIGDEPVTFASGLVLPLGMTFVEGDLVVSEQGSVVRLIDRDGDGVSDERETILTGLPVGGEFHQNHQNNGLALGPDGLLYVGVGIGIEVEDPSGGEDSTVRQEHLGVGTEGEPTGVPDPSLTDQRAGTIIRFRPDGAQEDIFATGFKNPIGLAFDAEGRLFATDIGANFPETSDELNVIVKGASYGYPRGPGGPVTEGDVPVAVRLEVAASNGFSFYYAQQFPEVYFGNAFVAQCGQSATDVPFSNRVVRVQLEERDGAISGSVRSFAVGFEHPIATAVTRDGSLMVADWGSFTGDGTGAVYRIFFAGEE